MEFDDRASCAAVAQVGIRNYDSTGQGNPTPGFLAPLFSNPADPHHSNSIETNIADYVAAGVPREKLLMGLPFYGYSWTGVEGVNNGLFQAGEGVRGDRPYHYIR